LVRDSLDNNADSTLKLLRGLIPNRHYRKKCIFVMLEYANKELGSNKSCMVDGNKVFRREEVFL
jgi:hypothetical protein